MIWVAALGHRGARAVLPARPAERRWRWRIPDARARTTSAGATAEPTTTPIPEPTPQTYTIKKGDILNKIAKKYDVTVEQLLEANKKTIKNPNKIKVGQEIIIPVPIPDEFTDPDAAEPSASAEERPRSRSPGGPGGRRAPERRS